MTLSTDSTDKTSLPNFLLGPQVSVLVDDDKKSKVSYLSDSDHELPSGIARGFYDAGNGLTLTYYYSTETNINNGAVSTVGLSGFKSDLALDPTEIQQLTTRNIPFGWLALNNPERRLDFLDDTKRACSQFIANPPHPIKEIIESRIPTALTAHSTGAQMLLEQSNKLEDYAYLSDNFCGMLLQSPMLETSPLFDSLSPKMQSMVLGWHASINPEALPEETTLGQIYLLINGMRAKPDPDRIFMRPTLGQIIVIRDNARQEILDKKGPHLLAKGDLPVAFFLGARDKSSDPATNISFAKSIGAAVFVDPKAGHAPICQRPRNMALFVRTLQEMANDSFDPSRHQPPETEPSSGRLGRTIQGSASLLNPLARPFKRFL